MKRAIGAAAAGFVLCSVAAADPIQLNVQRIETFGPALPGGSNASLQFVGGLELTSPDPRFGGLSGLDMTDGGSTAFFISDTGRYVRAHLTYEGGRLAGIANGEIGDIFSAGEVGKFDGDVEDVALDPENASQGVISIERQRDALRSFRLTNGHPGEFVSIKLDADPRILRSNRGLESVTYGAPGSPLAGKIVTIAERAYHNRGDTIPGWIVGMGSFSIVRHDDYDISSARFLPDGDLLILERRFSPAWGLALRLRRIRGSAVKPDARLDGDILLDAGMRSQIDNMEGLSVHRDAAKRTVLTLVSDDNFSILQRTLLLQFVLLDRSHPATN